MAAGKKSFVLYTDYDTIFEQLTDSEAGKIVKHLFKYVNDKEPELEDRMLKILFEPIKQQLKRDLKKWDKVLKKKSDGGKKGMAARWNKDNIPKHPITTDNILKDTLTPITDTVFVDDTVTDNVNGDDERQIEDEKFNNNSFFEKFRRVASSNITDKELRQEVGRFRNKYPNIHINQSGGLINAWVANIGKPKEKINERAKNLRAAKDEIERNK